MHARHAHRLARPPSPRVCFTVAPCLPARLPTCLPACLLHIQAGSINSDAANIELLQSAVTAEVQKLASGSDKASSAMERDMTDQMVRQQAARQQLLAVGITTHPVLGCCTSVGWPGLLASCRRAV